MPTKSLPDQQSIAQTVRQLVYPPDFVGGDLHRIAQTQKFDRGSPGGIVQDGVTGPGVPIPWLTHRARIDDESHLSVLPVEWKRFRQLVPVFEIEERLGTDATRTVEFAGEDAGDVGMAHEGMGARHREKRRGELRGFLNIFSEEVFGEGFLR